MGRPGSQGLTLRPFALDEALEKTYLHALDVFVPGDVSVTDLEGTTKVYTFPSVANGGCYPHRLEMLIAKVNTTGTTIALASLVGYH